jgi:hypothetical protein
MAAPYSSVSVSGYNSNPPADDGSSVASNQVKWSTVKTKLGDPLNTFAAAADAAIIAAFGKVIGGAGVTSTAVNYTVQSSDQGKLIRASAGSITITTPDASTVTSPFVFAVVNNSSGTVTFDGNGSQTVDGVASIDMPPGTGFTCYTDGTNWYTTGRQGTLVGAQLMYADIINATITESNSSNAVTVQVKTLAGNDPSANDPVLVCFRNSTIGNGNYVYRTLTSALSLTIPSTATMGASNGVAFKLWLTIFDDGGTLRLGAINCLNSLNIYPLGQIPLASSTAAGAGSDSAHVFYTGSAVTAKPYVIVGYASYESGLATAGTWNVSPTRLQLYGPGVPLPGMIVQDVATQTGAVNSGTTQIPVDDTIPQNTEGDEFMTQAITPVSVGNILEIRSSGFFSRSDTASITSAVFQDSTASALAAANVDPDTANALCQIEISHRMIAGTTSSTTFKTRAGGSGAGTTTFNGSGAARLFGGVLNSSMGVTEFMT